MSWLVWRQHRWDAAAAAAVLGGLGGLLLVVAFASESLLAQVGTACSSGDPNCGSLNAEYQAAFGRYMQYLIGAGMVVPALVGMFIGAPLLAREFEHGTNLLVWTQGITRRRWLLTQLGLIVIGVAVGSAVLGAVFQFWLEGQSAILNSWYAFEVAPPAVVAYAVFALALGTAMGAAIKRTLPAMAATIIGFVGLRIAIAQLARPYYVPPLNWDVGGSNGPLTRSMWLFGSIRYVDLSGHPVSEPRFQELTREYSSTAQASVGAGKVTPLLTLHDYLKEHGVLVIQSYQPDSRFWLFQGIEAAIFIALALVLLAAAYRLVMRSRQ